MNEFIIVAGCRPNFMKIAPLCMELKRQNFNFEIFYSGQHFDSDLFQIFKDELNLSNGYCANIEMTGNSIKDIQQIMVAFRNYILLPPWKHPSAILVVGDVNTTYACTLVAKRLTSC